MTPFGVKLREMRKAKAMSLKDLAQAIGVSSAYLSALEHGQRSRPSWYLIQRIIAHFNVIWDEAENLERLAALSHPRVTLDTSRLSPKACELANRLTENISKLSEDDIEEMLKIIKKSKAF
jgi:transcriptional regulator with XRE-family HTH domain